MPNPLADTDDLVRVKMLSDQFLSEFHRENGGRIVSGMVIDVSPETARRWIDLDIAEAAPSEQTTREQRKAELEAELARLRALEDEIDDEHVPQPVMRRGRAAKDADET